MFKFFRKKTYKVRCPDGTFRMLYYDINDAFPIYVKGNNNSVSAKVEGLDGVVNAGVQGEIKSNVENMLFSLDYFNNSLLPKFRAFYQAYEFNPCEGSSMFSLQISSLIEEYNKLNMLKLKIYGLVEALKTGNITEQDFSKNYIKLVSDNKEVFPQISTSIEIEKAQSDFNELQSRIKNEE